jgi:4-amino-4-deoxy-L-arabinose transferase-like glycosyltransferase
MSLENSSSTDKPNFTLWLFVLATVLIFSGLGLREPWPADEPRFAQIAKEMVETGQWFFPTRGGEYYPDKPPLFMWSIAFFYVLFGSIKIAFLLPSALCSLLTLALVYDISKRLWSSKEALIATSLLLFSFQFVLQAKTAQIDAMVGSWIMIGCYGFLRFLLVERQWRWYYLALFFMGIGVITKGVGFLPALILLPYFLYQRIWSQQKIAKSSSKNEIVRWLIGPIVMLLAISMWFVPMLVLVQTSQDPALFEYRDNILFKQTVTRYADSWHHIKPLWYYLVDVIPLFWLPISLALPWLIPNWYRAIRQGDARIILPLGWIVLVLLFFSISPGKRGVYILPALPMLAIISAPYFNSIINKKIFNWSLWALVLVVSIVLVGFGLSGLLDSTYTLELQEKFGISPWSFFTVTGGLASVLTVFTATKYRWKAWPYFMFSLWLLYSSWGYILLDDVKTPKRIFANIYKKIGHQEATIALVNFSEQFILFSPYRIVHFGYHSQADKQLSAAYMWLQNSSEARYVLINKKDTRAECFKEEALIPVGYAHRAQWVLLSRDALTDKCSLPKTSISAFKYEPPK